MFRRFDYYWYWFPRVAIIAVLLIGGAFININGAFENLNSTSTALVWLGLFRALLSGLIIFGYPLFAWRRWTLLRLYLKDFDKRHTGDINSPVNPKKLCRMSFGEIEDAIATELQLIELLED